MDISLVSSQLSPSPKAFPNCCLAISSTFINYLASILPERPGFTISIGSGSGLLEALITYRHPSLLITGIEVNQSINRYIAEENVYLVRGTWDLHTVATQARAWMFAYPREPKLIDKYINLYGDYAVEVILWLGPQADWVDYEPFFQRSLFSDINLPDGVGLMEFELLAVMRKKIRLPEDSG